MAKWEDRLIEVSKALESLVDDFREAYDDEADKDYQTVITSYDDIDELLGDMQQALYEFDQHEQRVSK